MLHYAAFSLSVVSQVLFNDECNLVYSGPRHIALMHASLLHITEAIEVTFHEEIILIDLPLN
jgi:hypothetical protein